MSRLFNLYVLAALLLLGSAIAHLAVFALSGGAMWLPMIAGALFWAAMARWLARRRRWVAHLTFLAAMAGGILALGYGAATPGLPGTGLAVIAGLDWLAAAVLFVLLWRDPRRRPAAD